MNIKLDLKTIGIILAILFVFIGFLKKDLLEKSLLDMIKKHPYVTALQAKNDSLAKELAAKVTVSGNQVVIKYRDREVVKEIVKEVNKETVKEIVKEIKIYKPPEGKVDIVTLNSTSPVNQNFWQNWTTDIYEVPGSSMVVIVKVGGFTFKSAISCLVPINAQICPNLDFRFFYWRRWGVAALTFPVSGICIDRRIDDYIGLFQNTTVGIFGGYSNLEQKPVLGLRIGVFL